MIDTTKPIRPRARDIAARFTSRRFLLAAGTLVLETLGISLPPEVLGVVGAFILGESVVDAAGAKRPNVSMTPALPVPAVAEICEICAEPRTMHTGDGFTSDVPITHSYRAYRGR